MISRRVQNLDLAGVASECGQRQLPHLMDAERARRYLTTCRKEPDLQGSGSEDVSHKARQILEHLLRSMFVIPLDPD